MTLWPNPLTLPDAAPNPTNVRIIPGKLYGGITQAGLVVLALHEAHDADAIPPVTIQNAVVQMTADTLDEVLAYLSDLRKRV